MENQTVTCLSLPMQEVVRCEKGKECEYYLNEELMTDEEGKPLSEAKVQSYVSSLVRSFCLPTDNVVLLAGSGASVVSDNSGTINLKYGLTMKELREEVFKGLDCKSQDGKTYNFSQLARMISFPVQKDDTNLEEFLSALIESEVFIKKGKKKYAKTIEAILDIIISKTSYDYDPKIFKHAVLIQVLSALVKRPNRLSVVTTNYDTLFEDAADSIDFTVFDGFNFTHTQKFNVDMFDWSLAKSVSNIRSSKMEYKNSIINLLKIHGSLTWMRDGNGNVVRKEKKEIQNPLMIFPSSSKYRQSYENPYFELLSKFQELLKMQNTVLITTGFSFADNHISQMIFRAVKHNPGLSILACDYSLEQANKCQNWKELIQLQKDGFRIGFCKATLDKNLTSVFESGDVYD